MQNVSVSAGVYTTNVFIAVITNAIGVYASECVRCLFGL
jgi:hypothetical protein